MNPRKVYVKVIAEHNPDTGTKPLSLTWSDGRTYEIDRVLDRRKTTSLEAGGWGTRYNCRILGQLRYWFDEGGRWFVEGK